VYPKLAEDLFGRHAFVDPDYDDYMRPPIRQFIDVVMANTWNRYRKTISHEQNYMAGLRKAVEELWKGEYVLFSSTVPSDETIAELTEDPAKSPTALKIRQYITKVDALLVRIRRYGDAKSGKELEDRRQQLQNMLAAMGSNGKQGDKMSKYSVSCIG
jgi:hypothetical protein